MHGVLKNIFGSVYGIIFSFLIWVLFHYLTPYVVPMDFSEFIDVFIGGTIGCGLILVVVGILSIPVNYLCSSKVSRITVLAFMILNALLSVLNVFNLNIEYTPIRICISVIYSCFIAVLYFVVSNICLDKKVLSSK